MKILAIDTSTDNLGVAIWDKNSGISEVFSQKAFRKQSSMLHLTIADILAKYGITAQCIDLVVTTKGPGSFTGIRVSMSAAQGIAKGLNIPIVGVSTLHVMSAENEKSIVWMGAVRGEVYVQAFNEKSIPVTKPVILPIEEASKQLKNGDLLHINGEISLIDNMPKVTVKNISVCPLKLAKIGYDIYKKEGSKLIVPLYLSQLEYRKLSDNI